MEKKCAQWYRNFKSPPESKTFYPTEAEFSDPITYVEKIRAEGEKYGVVKVVPPPSFQPPYIINEDTFRFKTRVQPLYGIDALCRNRIFFVHELKVFWKNAGREFQWPYINNIYIDFVRLRELVKQCGGVDEVNKQRKWADFAQILGFDRTDCVTLKDRYVKWIVPFEEHWPKRDELATKMINMESKSATRVTEERVKLDSQTAPRMSTRQSSSRMMAGTRGRKPQQSLTTAHTLVQENSCGKCFKRTDSESMVTCSECHQEFHKACLSRMISSRLVKDWKCLQCLIADVHEADFFFSDNDQQQSLRMFRNMANDFKAKHFGESNPAEISINRIEREYWKRVGDFDCSIKVEYGADLLSSEISSGFPRLSDDIRNQSDSELRLEYAKHPWNLNNLPVLDRSVLGHVGTEISGMMIPWVYAGMCFSTFCWHVEDHWTYSMNYMHRGETKVWYGFGEQYAEEFDALIKRTMPALFDRSPDLLHHMNTAVNPMFLIDNGIPVHTVRQNVNEFVITFPRAYHAGFNAGFNIAEAVNFAPPDWLAVGRQCVESYTKDQRRCVFAHDELVLRIAQTEQRLDIKTCRAVIIELSELLAREQMFRSALLNAGVRNSEACDFEHLDDDHRSCAICQTTLFITALRCKHDEKGLACSRHWRQLCTDCSTDECVIKYRYSLKQLSDFAERLTRRVEAADEWRQVVDEALQTGQKITASDAKALLDSFNSQNLFECSEQIHLEKELANYRTVLAKAQQILRPTIRLRDDTRCQRVDDRLTSVELDTLIADLNLDIIEDADLLEKLKKRRAQIKEWQMKVTKAIREMRKKLTNAQSLQALETFKSEGEAFNVRLEEIDVLKQLMDYSEWHMEVNELIQRCTRAQNYALALTQSLKREIKTGENSNTGLFDDDSRTCYKKLKLLIEKGSRLIHYIDEAADLLETLQQINTHINISTFLATKSVTTFADVIAFNKSVLDLDWLSSDLLDEFRDKFQLANDAWSQYMDLEQSPDFYYYTLDQVIGKFQQSSLLAGSHPHQNAIVARKLLSDFTREVNTIFLPSLTYYSTFEVLAAREDIPSIIEGGPEALYRQPSNSGFDDWTDLKRFETEDEMCNHVNQLFSEQRKLLIALRQHNQRASTADTCLRAPNCSEETDEVLICFVCCAKDHLSCAAWNKPLNRYPPGLYLCVRCCRSNRPDRKTVRQMVHNAPVRARESTFLQTCASKIFHMLDRLKRATDCTVYESGLTPLHVALSMEIHDDEVMTELFAKFLTPQTFSSSDIQFWNRLALQEPTLPLCIYGYDDSSPIKKKRSRLRRSSIPLSKKQKMMPEIEEKMVVCGVVGCVMPQVASKVRWVMCEAGCSRWFHYICVNLTVKTVNSVQQYKCADCQRDQVTPMKISGKALEEEVILVD